MVVKKLGANETDEIMLSSGATPHSDIEPPTEDLIERTLNRMGLTSLRDPDGDFCSVFRDETTAFCCWYRLVGEHGSIFRLTGLIEPELPIQQLPEALFTCQSYHNRYRFGRLYPYIPEGEEEFRLCFEVQLDLSPGATVDFLRTLITSHLASICDFLKTPPVQKLLSPAPKRKPRTTTRSKGVSHKS